MPTGLYCVVCGFDLPSSAIRDSWKPVLEREDWGAKAQDALEGRSVIVSAAELEATDFTRDPCTWSMFFRIILDDPRNNAPCITGITYTRPNQTDTRVPTQPHRAFIWGDPTRKSRWNTGFQIVDILEKNPIKKPGVPLGYPIHAHCWLLANRVIGHDVVEQNLRAFIKAIEAFWKRKGKRQELSTEHSCKSVVCFCHDMRSSYPGEEWVPKQTLKHYIFCSPSPYRIPEIEDLLARATSNREKPGKLRESCTDVSQDIAMIIVDTVFRGYKPEDYQEAISDVENLLEAFQWTLHDDYWMKRSSGWRSLIYEVDDRIRVGKKIDWATLTLGVEEMLVSFDWYFDSGLYLRARVMESLREMEQDFLELVEGNGDIVIT